jgi:Protein of unknown function (DUF2934)
MIQSESQSSPHLATISWMLGHLCRTIQTVSKGVGVGASSKQLENDREKKARPSDCRLGRASSLMICAVPADKPQPRAYWSLEMAKPTEQEIAARAYRLWEAAGMPKDRDEEFWHAAEQELLNEDKSNPRQTPDTL